MSSATAASLRLPAPVVPSRASLRPRRANSAVRTFACHDAKVVRVSARETCGEVVAWLGKTACAVGLCLTLTAGGAQARMEGVNKPELLPTGDFTPVIDVAGFLTDGEEARIRTTVNQLEADTGFKLRVLAQNYPDTPGLAIRDYWGVDANTVVFVADPNTGNILNFNVGENVDLAVPRNFWTRLASKYGNKFFWQEQGEASAMLNAVSAVSNCLHEPIGRGQCSNIRGMEVPLESLF